MISISNRVVLIIFNASSCNLYSIQVYGTALNSGENEVRTSYGHLRTAPRNTKKHEVNLLMGNFRPKVGNQKQDKIIENYEFGTRNERGGILVQFCKKTQFTIILNSLPEHYIRATVSGEQSR